ncbi:MAG TPA: SRPBCC family protein [Gemmatimonas sp.]|uniref:SRPBCC family protein n=1 Tax=Gemmatimonas sp. TaxID=1962908 RepID=UPI002ED7AF6F
MPITEVVSNAQDLTLTIIADYPVSVERLWDAYVDPRQLERFWGPEQWPATFTRHDVAEGGESHYHMTGPDGTKAPGWFRFTAVEPHKRIALVDGFGENGTPTPGMPTMEMVFTFHSTDTGSRFRSVTTFPSIEAMEQLVQMGMVEGIKSAMSQTDAVLADLHSFAVGRITDAQMLSDTQVRVSRVIRGNIEQVWQAHHDPALVPRWLTGPDGWTMPVCRTANTVGDHYRYEWEKTDGTERFGFEGELLEMAGPYRAVTTEEMIDTGGPSTHNELTLTPVEGGTLLSLVITYPTRELRDMILGTGMTKGMETSYARLEGVLQAA